MVMMSGVTAAQAVSRDLGLDATFHVYPTKAVDFYKPGTDGYDDRLTDVALIGIVGDGIQHRYGIAARCFTAVANCRVNVEMISFGPSRAALYFLVKKKEL